MRNVTGHLKSDASGRYGPSGKKSSITNYHIGFLLQQTYLADSAVDSLVGNWTLSTFLRTNMEPQKGSHKDTALLRGV